MSGKQGYPYTLTITLSDLTYSGAGTIKYLTPLGVEDSADVTFTLGVASHTFTDIETAGFDIGTYKIIAVKTDTNTPTCTGSFSIIGEFEGSC